METPFNKMIQVIVTFKNKKSRALRKIC